MHGEGTEGGGQAFESFSVTNGAEQAENCVVLLPEVEIPHVGDLEPRAWKFALGDLDEAWLDVDAIDEVAIGLLEPKGVLAGATADVEEAVGLRGKAFQQGVDFRSFCTVILQVSVDKIVICCGTVVHGTDFVAKRLDMSSVAYFGEGFEFGTCPKAFCIRQSSVHTCPFVTPRKLTMYPKIFSRFSFLILSVACFVLPSALFSQSGLVIPKEDWVDDYNPIASPDAVVGGRVKIALGPFPSSFNAITNYTYQSIVVFTHLYDPLMDMDPMTLEWSPRIARQIEVSEDQLTFLVHLDPAAKWNDGKAITSADFKFTFDTIMDPKNIVGPWRNAFEDFENLKIIDDHTFQISSKELHWRNLNAIAGFSILPKHYFEGKDFNKANFEFAVVSGRYELTNVTEGVSIEFTRRNDWWLEGQKRYEGTSNFQQIEYRFYADDELTFDVFKKGEIDIYPVHSSEIWASRSVGDVFDKNWIVKQRVVNDEPLPYQGFAINMRRAPFDDVRVRKAMAHLLDRVRINETMMHSQYFLLKSFLTKLYDEEHPNTNELFDFNPEKARALLKEAGWVVDPADGKLKKDGKPFEFTFLLRSPTWSKFLVVYQEALKDVGIEMKIQMTDWAAWTKEMDEFNFDMTLAAWGLPVFSDPEGAWHSKQATEKGGNNISGLQNAEIDALIEKQKSIFDVKVRNGILREIDHIAYNEVPMILAWMIDYKRLLYWNKFGTPVTVLDRYADEEAAYHYWWIDPDQEADLEHARESGESLPPRPVEVRFWDAYEG